MEELEKTEGMTEEAVPAEEETAETAEPEEDEVSTLKKQIADLEANVADLKNAYARAYADTENTRKRLSADFEQRNKYRIHDFALEILPVLDNCERALALETEEDTPDTYRKGFEMVHRQLLAALKKEGVEEIEALNEPFDPNWHQALMSEHRDGVEPGINIEVLQKGYKLKDRLLRAAMVKISE